MDRMTEQTAAGLIQRIDDLTDAVEVAEQQAATNKALAEKADRVSKSSRRHTYWLWSVVALLAVFALWLRSTAQSASEAADEAARAAQAAQAVQVTACESGNLRLAGQRKIWSFFFEVTAASAKARQEPPAVLHFYDAYLHWITDEVLPDRDCEHLDQTIDEPGPPPSFEKALQKSLEHAAHNGQ